MIFYIILTQIHINYPYIDIQVNNQLTNQSGEFKYIQIWTEYYEFCKYVCSHSKNQQQKKTSFLFCHNSFVNH